MKLSAYSMSEFLETVIDLTKKGYEVDAYGSCKVGLGTYIVDYSGEVEKAIEEIQEAQENEIDWNALSELTKKEIAEYALQNDKIVISTQQNKALMIEEYQKELKLG